MIVISLALVHVESITVILGSGANIRLTKLAGRAVVRRGPCDGKLIKCSSIIVIPKLFY